VKNIFTKGLIGTTCMLIIISLSFGMLGCISKSGSSGKETKGKEKKSPIVTIEMEDGSKIKIELYPEIAPNTVNNFVSLVQKGFYDGTIFHRVLPGFMIQGGDPQGTGTGGPGYSIKGEFTNNKFKNELKHDRGVISMARSQSPDSAGSQFFIMVDKAPHLDGEYAAFGKVIEEGMKVVDKIVLTTRNSADKPIKEQKMKKVTVETFGEKYEDPKKINGK
jgi:peptidyl-prolyl cis-trans isomerase B (cyclophilin B)